MIEVGKFYTIENWGPKSNDTSWAGRALLAEAVDYPYVTMNYRNMAIRLDLRKVELKCLNDMEAAKILRRG